MKKEIPCSRNKIKNHTNKKLVHRSKTAVTIPAEASADTTQLRHFLAETIAKQVFSGKGQR